MSFWNGREWVDEGPPATDVKREGRVKHIAKAVLEAGLITVLTFGLIAGSAFAAKGGGRAGSGDGSISLDAASATPSYGEKIHFAVSTGSAYPVVTVSCSQGGTTVYGDSRPYYWPNPWNDDGIFTLSSMSWSGGGADCVATLKVSGKNRPVTLASTAFFVSP